MCFGDRWCYRCSGRRGRQYCSAAADVVRVAIAGALVFTAAVATSAAVATASTWVAALRLDTMASIAIVGPAAAPPITSAQTINNRLTNVAFRS